MASGYLYIITNKSWQGWIKVGTTRNLKKRLQTYQTGSPFRDYEVIYSFMENVIIPSPTLKSLQMR